MMRARAASILMISLLAGGGGTMIDLTGDVIVDRVPVPSADRPQGEVRIVRRNGRLVVQTLLKTKVLKRVIGAIADKERRGWPEGASGYADARRYLAALETFQQAALAQRDAAGPDADRHVNALIEFIDAPERPFVAIGSAEIDGAKNEMRLVGRAAPVIIELSAEYVRRNMRLIVADAFHVTPEEASARIARAGAK